MFPTSTNQEILLFAVRVVFCAKRAMLTNCLFLDIDMQPVIFFDRDGIVNACVMGGYVTDVNDFLFLPDFFPFLTAVKQRGLRAILITNQQGIGKGLMSEDDLHRIHEFMQAELAHRTGWTFDDIFFAGELDATSSKYKDCCSDEFVPPPEHIRRKPSPAMLLEAAKKWDIDLAASWMIGDSISDAQAGRAAGCRTLLVGVFTPNDTPEADYIVPSLKAARELWLDLQWARETVISSQIPQLRA
jgi:D-glycero-D-manno-heptose 1,7-bisphosphate phosphatase